MIDGLMLEIKGAFGYTHQVGSMNTMRMYINTGEAEFNWNVYNLKVQLIRKYKHKYDGKVWV